MSGDFNTTLTANDRLNKNNTKSTSHKMEKKSFYPYKHTQTNWHMERNKQREKSIYMEKKK